MQYVTLAGTDGALMPVVGLGTWRAPVDEVQQSLEIALANGYRHIDTAFVYNNEEAIGNVLKKWLAEDRVKRSELFVTTKLPAIGNRPSDVERFLKMSLKRLNLDYVDLYLIHLPMALICDEGTLQPAKNEDGTIKLDLTNNNLETWQMMEQQVTNGLARAIGLSNFNASQVREIYDNSQIKPAVLQVEIHAYHQQRELINACREMNIAVTAYSPLGSPGASKYFADKYNYEATSSPSVLEDIVVKGLSEKYERTPGQILLKHLLQKGLIIIPKSGNPKRIKENIELFDFEISEEDVSILDHLDKEGDGRIFTFLFFQDVEKHPHYPFLRE